ncbi:FAD-binding protein [Polaromonas sp. P1(28)-13]|nr:FAD-binding protein [Polaromonas sp. P1(28)-13]
MLGGTTATSGGSIWVPGTTQSQRTATPDTVQAARTYLDGEVGAHGPADQREAQTQLREAFYASGAAAIDFLEKESEVKFKANSPYPDYHPDRPGGAQGGRALSPLAFDACTRQRLRTGTPTRARLSGTRRNDGRPR